MASRSMDANPLVIRVKNREELMRLKQFEGLVRDLGKQVTIRYLEYLLRDTHKVVQCQVPEHIDKNPTAAVSNPNKGGPLQHMNNPKVEQLGKFSYNQFLTSKDGNKITFEEFITAAHRWGANVSGATANDLKGYLLHLGSVSAMAATRRYDQQMHVDYDKAIRKKAEGVGWAAFRADNTAVANLFYITKKKEEHFNEAEEMNSDSDHHVLQDTVVADEHQSTEPIICYTSEAVDLHHEEEDDNYADHENHEDQGMTYGTKGDRSAQLPQDMADSMLPSPAVLVDDTSDKLYISSDVASAHSSVVSNQANLDAPEVIPKRHICSHCSKGFGSAITLKVHLRRHTAKSHAPGALGIQEHHICSYCSKEFRSATTLKVHLRRHTPKPPASSKPHLCSICGKQFQFPSELKQHMRHHTGERPFPCTVCGKKLISAASLSEHMLTHTGKKNYVCSYCGKQFLHSSSLRIHTRIHTGEKPHVCPYCGKGFRGSGYMKSHMLVHTKEKLYKCSKCDRRFSISGNLKRHMLIHTGRKRYQCPYCPQACTQKSSLNAHIDAFHRGEGPKRRKSKNSGNVEKAHTCSDCGKQYIYLANLKLHMISHTGGDPLTCPDCSKRCVSIQALRYHLRKHTEERPYECKECGKGFPSSAHLDLHAVVHTGEKPYACSDCGKAFSVPANLSKHKKIHTGEKPHVCSYCGKAFGQKSALQLHIMIHTGEKPFVCAECGKGFSRGADLRKHLKVHGGKIA